MIKKIKHLSCNIVNFLRSVFLNGLFTILPIILTFGIFAITLRLLQSWLKPISKIQPAFLQCIPYSEIILAIIIIFLIGTILKIFVLRSLIHWIEGLFAKIPLVRPIYMGIKHLVQAFSSQDKITFKKIVLIEFPRKGLFSIGFLTSELVTELSPDKEKKFFNVFVPTTPNPTSGHFVIIPEDQISVTNLSRQEAMAMIISGGIIQPDRFLNS